MRLVSRMLGLTAALAIIACGDEPVGPLPQDAVDGEFESWVLATTGVTTDQANSSSVMGDAAWVAHQPLFFPNLTCAFDAAAGRVICADVTVNGLTISRSFAFYDADGNVQPSRGPATTTVNSRVWVRGTVNRDSVTVTLDRQSDLTATGVQQGSTRRTLNGVDEGSSEIEARLARGTFISTLEHADSTRNLIVAHNDPTAPRWPLGGSIVRTAQGTRSREGSDDVRSFTRREEIVFDGSNRAALTITVNGQTRTCTIFLDERRVRCQ